MILELDYKNKTILIRDNVVLSELNKIMSDKQDWTIIQDADVDVWSSQYYQLPYYYSDPSFTVTCGGSISGNTISDGYLDLSTDNRQN